MAACIDPPCRYDKALHDADHSIALMDFAWKFATDADYIGLHERYRGRPAPERRELVAAAARLDKPQA